MILAVEQPDAEVDHRISREITAAPRILNALLNGGDVLARNRAAENLVDEFEVGAARQRLDLDLAIGELTMTARLLLVAAVRVGRFGDRFAIRHLRRMKDDLDAVLLLQLRNDDLHVQLTLAADEHLVRPLIASEVNARIFLHDAGEGGVDLVLIAARLRLDRERDRRLGILHMFDEERVIFRGECVAGVNVFEFRHRADVARFELGDRDLLLALEQLQFSDALFVIFARVPVGRVGFERARVDAEQRDAAGERIGERFEDQRSRKCFGAALEGDFFALGVFPVDGLGFVG